MARNMSDYLQQFEQQLADAVKAQHQAHDLVHRARLTLVHIRQHVREPIDQPKVDRLILVTGAQKTFTISLARLTELITKEAMLAQQPARLAPRGGWAALQKRAALKKRPRSKKKT